jgi:4-hydroxybenzoyl-CoA reductase subunit beta
MMRLPAFRYLAPATVAEAVGMLASEGPGAAVVAGGTDLYPNMKRRHQTPTTLVALRKVAELRGVAETADGNLRLGPATTLSALERNPILPARYPALAAAVRSISTPLLRNMGTIGGNVLLDTRCNYYNQSYEWRRAINFCLKCDGTTCSVAPGSDRCWAVNSSDSVPVLIALGAKVRFASPRGEREVDVEALYRDDGIAWLAKEPDEVLTDVLIPPPGAARTHYGKLRRRGSFDFPVLGVATTVTLDGEQVGSVRIVLNGVGSAPIRAKEAEAFLVGKRLDEPVIRAAADLAYRPAKPLDNTDLEYSYRKKMVKVYVRGGLQVIAAGTGSSAQGG